MPVNVQISSPTIYFPGTHCDERIWMPSWRSMNMNQRSYVPLQWAESLEQMLALSSDRINTFAEKVHLIGFSMGGYIATLSALQHQDKIASLTLIGYNPRGLTSQEIKNRQVLTKSLERNKSKSFEKSQLKARMAKFLTANELNTPEILDVLGDMESDLGHAVLKAHIQSTTPRNDMRDALGEFTFPIHFVVGEYDQIAPATEVLAVSKQTKVGSYTLIKNSAHMLPITKPTEIADLLTSKLS